MLGLKYESCMVEKDVIELDSKQKTKVIREEVAKGVELSDENNKLKKKLAFQKKLKWFTGAVGLITGVLVVTVF